VLLAVDGQKHTARLAAQCLIHIGRELLRANLLQEQLVQVRQERLRRLCW
jgi:hypothetical protein